MKRLITILCLFSSLILNSQVTTIYTEDFSNDWKKGAITYGGVTPSQPTDGNWSWVNVGSPDNDGGSASSWDDMAFIDGAAVMSTNGATSSTLAFRWNDVNNGNSNNRVDWYTKSISGAYSTITASMTYAIGNGSSANSIWVYYKIDGGAWTLFGSSTNQSTASGTFTSSTLSCSSSIQLAVTAVTRDFNSSYVLIDNVQITACATVVPSVSITSSDADNTICTGTSVTFTATPTNGGSTPSYQWKKNGSNVGTNSTTYTNASLANGDAITCVMTTSASCPSTSTATSNSISTTVNSSSIGGSVASDQNVTSGGNAATITLSGHTGSIVKWQRSTVLDFSTYTDVANTTTSVSGASMGAITETIYYRAVVQNGVCSSVNSSYVTISVVSPLPITLLYFQGKNWGKNNKLIWSTASEQSNDYFTIEKSEDGYIFDEVVRVKGAGNSINTLYYSEFDYGVKPGIINYYRLKQTDYDGRYEISDIISIDNTDNAPKAKEVKFFNIVGQEVDGETYNGEVFITYEDGSVKRVTLRHE